MITIRMMAGDEVKPALKLARKAFAGIECLFISKPKTGIVALIDNQIVGGVFVKQISIQNGSLGYLDTVFVDPACQGQGIGRQLVAAASDYLLQQGCQVLSGIVKDDNVGSWQSFLDSGYKRVSLKEAAHHLGMDGMLKQYFVTPLFACNGMELYLNVKTAPLDAKKVHSLPQIITYLGLNAVLMLAAYFNHQPFNLFLCIYLFLLAGGVLFGWLGSCLTKREWYFRLNSGGAVLVAFINFVGGLYPMIGSWYPKQYENTPAFRKAIGITALCEWRFYLAITLLAFLMANQASIFKLTASLGSVFLLYRIIAVYPFESYGGKRVYQWHKAVFLLMAGLSLGLILMVNGLL